ARLIQKAKLTARLKENPKNLRTKFWTVDLSSAFSGASKRVWIKAISRDDARIQAEKQNAGYRWIQIREGKIGYKDNPNANGYIRQNPFDAYESFQGRPSTKTLKLRTPENAPAQLYALGKLFEIKVKGQREPINFRSEHTGRTYYLCADLNNHQMWIAGAASSDPQPALHKGEAEPVGEMVYVVYETIKTHLGDEDPTAYIHHLGEEGGQKPIFALDRNGFAIIAEGDYFITPDGIRD
ncbi:MAG TPA: hypothetical protein VGB00_09400, partial [Pyrinomonadaceae bacterium]